MRQTEKKHSSHWLYTPVGMTISEGVDTPSGTDYAGSSPQKGRILHFQENRQFHHITFI